MNENHKLTPPTKVLRQPNYMVAMSPINQKLTGTMRKLFLAMIFHAQREDNRNTYIYSCTLGELMGSSAYSSRNTAGLKEQLKALERSQVEWNRWSRKITPWGRSGMISQVKVIERKGHPTIVEWSLPNNMRDELLAPQYYTALELSMATMFRSGASIALYQWCSSYKTNPSRLTKCHPWEWFCPIITGNPEISIDEYKYFKRDVLKKAIAEINAMSDITVEIIEHKRGTAIVEIQFLVKRKEEVFRAFRTNDTFKEIDMDVLHSIVQLGIKPDQAKKFCSEHDAVFLSKTIALVRQRVSDLHSPKIKSEAAYFRAAIKDRYVDQVDKIPAKNEIKSNTDMPAPPTNLELVEVERIYMAESAYRELSIEDQAARREEFGKSTRTDFYAKEIKRYGLERSTALKAAFYAWFANTLWEALETDLPRDVASEKI